MSDDVRADARRLLQGITAGAWCIWEDLDHQGFRTVGDATSYAELIANGECDECNPVAHVYADHDAEFIAAAPRLVAGLLQALDRAEDEIDAN